MGTTIQYEDFIGFTYNGKHSSELGIIRTSKSDRYTETIVAPRRDVTQPAVGHDGVYLISSTVAPKEFAVDFAFDNLSEEQVHQLSLTFDGLAVHELIFDEYPYKVYDAKVKSPPTIKVIPFDNAQGKTIYKGEGSVQFIAYYPYAHTPTELVEDNDVVSYDGRYKEYYEQKGYTNIEEWIGPTGIKPYNNTHNLHLSGAYNPGDLPAPFILEIPNVEIAEQVITLYNGVNEYNQITTGMFILENCKELVWDSKTGLITGMVNGVRRPIKYEGNALRTIGITTGAATNNSIQSASYIYSYWYY